MHNHLNQKSSHFTSVVSEMANLSKSLSGSFLLVFFAACLFSLTGCSFHELPFSVIAVLAVVAIAVVVVIIAVAVMALKASGGFSKKYVPSDEDCNDEEE